MHIVVELIFHLVRFELLKVTFLLKYFYFNWNFFHIILFIYFNMKFKAWVTKKDYRILPIFFM
jgi:hypothetical protein